MGFYWRKCIRSIAKQMAFTTGKCISKTRVSHAGVAMLRSILPPTNHMNNCLEENKLVGKLMDTVREFGEAHCQPTYSRAHEKSLHHEPSYSCAVHSEKRTKTETCLVSVTTVSLYKLIQYTLYVSLEKLIARQHTVGPTRNHFTVRGVVGVTVRVSPSHDISERWILAIICSK